MKQVVVFALLLQFTLVSVEQRTYAEYVDSLDSTTYLTMFSAEPHRPGA